MTLHRDAPLTGIRVLDMTTLLPGPLATLYLSDLGAEVIKIEHPRMGDPMRRMSQNDRKSKEGLSHFFQLLNRGKKSVSLNFKRAQGLELLLRLAQSADVLITSAPKDILDPEEMQERFPRLIYCSLTGYGQQGSRQGFAGHDANFAALSGLLALTAAQDQRPELPEFQIADIVGGSWPALASILTALYVRERSGEGQYIDLSIADGALANLYLSLGYFLETGVAPEKGRGLFSGQLPSYRIYRTMDGRYVVLASLEEVFWKNFLRKIGREDLMPLSVQIPEERGVLHRELEKIFSERSFEQWSVLFDDPGVCLSPVLSIPEVIRQNHFLERGTIFFDAGDVFMEHPHIAGPFHFSKTKPVYRTRAPRLGEHNHEVLAALGIGQAEIAALRLGKIL